MGTYNKGILGSFSGKVGTVVGASWRGKNVMRSLPRKSTKPPTDEQLLQRTVFSVVVKFLNPIKSIVGTYFGKQQGDKSPFNLATGYHMLEAVDDIGNEIVIDFPRVLISRGDLQGVVGGSYSYAQPGMIDMLWTDNSGQGNAAPDDQLIVVLYAPAINTFSVYNPAGLRADGQTVLNYDPFFEGLDVHGWATFVKADGSLAATSVYLGELTLA
jgi:hypothetical protein